MPRSLWLALLALVIALFPSCEEPVPEGGIALMYDVAGPEQDELSLDRTAHILRQRFGRTTDVVRGPGRGVRIECPWSWFRVTTVLTAAIDASETMLAVTPNEDLPSSGWVAVGQELMRYGSLQGGKLLGVERGHFDTTAAPHARGATVRLIDLENLRKRAETRGVLRFMFKANTRKFEEHETTRSEEERRVLEWCRDHPEAEIDVYNQTPRDQGGPPPGVLWYPMRSTSGPHEPIYRALALPENPEWHFDQSDLDTVYAGEDTFGYPAVVFEMAAGRAKAFGDMTEEYTRHALAIVLDQEIVVLATINSRLPGGGFIDGGRNAFTMEEVKVILSVLRTKPLPHPIRWKGASLFE